MSARTLPRTKVVSAVVAVLLVAVAAIGLRLSEPPEEFEAVNAPLATWVPYVDGSAQVSDVRVASVLKRNQASTSTEGLFVVLRIALRASGRDQLRISKTQLLARDATYEAVGLTSVTAETGFESATDFVFEVDPTRIDDLTLSAWTTQGFVVGYDQRLRVHLGITPANADAWRAAGRGRVLTVDLDPTTRGLG